MVTAWKPVDSFRTEMDTPGKVIPSPSKATPVIEASVDCAFTKLKLSKKN
jgi:hypothetical protein